MSPAWHFHVQFPVHGPQVVVVVGPAVVVVVAVSLQAVSVWEQLEVGVTVGYSQLHPVQLRKI